MTYVHLVYSLKSYTSCFDNRVDIKRGHQGLQEAHGGRWHVWRWRWPEVWDTKHPRLRDASQTHKQVWHDGNGSRNARAEKFEDSESEQKLGSQVGGWESESETSEKLGHTETESSRKEPSATAHAEVIRLSSEALSEIVRLSSRAPSARKKPDLRAEIARIPSMALSAGWQTTFQIGAVGPLNCNSKWLLWRISQWNTKSRTYFNSRTSASPSDPCAHNYTIFVCHSLAGSGNPKENPRDWTNWAGFPNLTEHTVQYILDSVTSPGLPSFFNECLHCAAMGSGTFFACCLFSRSSVATTGRNTQSQRGQRTASESWQPVHTNVQHWVLALTSSICGRLFFSLVQDSGFLWLLRFRNQGAATSEDPKRRCDFWEAPGQSVFILLQIMPLIVVWDNC